MKDQITAFPGIKNQCNYQNMSVIHCALTEMSQSTHTRL